MESLESCSISCSFKEGKSTGRSEVVFSVMESSELSDAGFSVFSVVPVGSVSVFSV